MGMKNGKEGRQKKRKGKRRKLYQKGERKKEEIASEMVKNALKSPAAYIYAGGKMNFKGVWGGG